MHTHTPTSLSMSHHATITLLLALLILHDDTNAAIEFETEQGWTVADSKTPLLQKDIEAVLIHSTDVSRLHDGRSLPSLHCSDSFKGIAAWTLNLPSCAQLFHSQNCVYCKSKSSHCCSLDLECESCIKQHHIELHNPRVLCDSYNKHSLRTIDGSSCVLEFELAQSNYIVVIEIALLAWFIAYNLTLFFIINCTHKSWIIKTREYGIAGLLSFTALPMFEFYVYIQSWYVLIPFSIMYVFFCALPPLRLFAHITAAKHKKEIV